MTIMIQFISLFLYILLTVGFPCSDLFQAQKIINNIEEAPFCSTETKNNLRVKTVIEREIGFLFEIK